MSLSHNQANQTLLDGQVVVLTHDATTGAELAVSAVNLSHHTDTKRRLDGPVVGHSHERR